MTETHKFRFMMLQHTARWGVRLKEVLVESEWEEARLDGLSNEVRRGRSR